METRRHLAGHICQWSAFAWLLTVGIVLVPDPWCLGQMGMGGMGGMSGMGGSPDPALHKLFLSKDVDVRQKVAAALDRLDDKDQRFEVTVPRFWEAWGRGGNRRPVLTELLRDQDADVRRPRPLSFGECRAECQVRCPAPCGTPPGSARLRYCHWALGQIGPEARNAIPALAELLQDEKDYVRAPLRRLWGRSAPRRKARSPQSWRSSATSTPRARVRQGRHCEELERTASRDW